MRRYKIITLTFFLVVLTSSFAELHKFYVSVTQIDYNVKKSRIEISSRIFIDDLEKAIFVKTNKKANLATSIEVSNAKELIEQYVLQKLQVNINNINQKVVFLGYEYEDDVLICYLKVDFSGKITTFEIENKLLVDIFPEQQNIIHTNINNSKQSFLLTLREKSTKIEY